MTIAGVATAFPGIRYDPGFLSGGFHDHRVELAQQIGQKALCEALARADVSASELSALFFVSMTGLSCPPVEARLVNCMGLPSNMKRMPISGLGCVGGAAAISRAADYVEAFPNEVAAVVAVELSSLTLQQHDASMTHADGAAAVLVTGAERRAGGPRIVATRSVFYADPEDVMGWKISENGFRFVLSSEVPGIVQEHLAADVDIFLDDQGLSRSGIENWVLHTGGPRGLEGTAAALGLRREDLAASWHCLREMGNLSSASVLAGLEEVMMNRRPSDSSYGLLVAMGPRFCSELVLMQW
jgi:alkylresorcinol/alkylpyrone synthase